MEPKKALGQHWLKDRATLKSICREAELQQSDFVLEIGPGLGDLTRLILEQAGQVSAVELDNELAANLRRQLPMDNLKIISGNILEFDLTQLPAGYKIVANIPYYLTSNLIRILTDTANPPSTAVLLVQREVAERIAAQTGQMSLLSVSAQLYYEPRLGPVVPAELFEPPPKVDSRVVTLQYRQKPLFTDLETKVFFRLVKAGFAGRRKKLHSSLAAGLNIDKRRIDELLKETAISGDLRAQNLSLADWHKLYKAFKSTNMETL